MTNEYPNNEYSLQENQIEENRIKNKNTKISEDTFNEPNIEHAFSMINEIIKKKDNQLKFLETIIQRKDEEITLLKNELIKYKGSSISNMIDKPQFYDQSNKKEINDSDFSNDEINQFKLKLNKRNTSNNNSTEHIKIINSNFKDGKVNSNLINSLNSIDMNSKERFKHDYNDYNLDKNTNNLNYNETNTSTTGSRNKVKEFLNEVKEKLDSKRFKVFIKNVKILTDKSQNVNRKQVFDQVKAIFGEDQFDLYYKFESILSPSAQR